MGIPYTSGPAFPGAAVSVPIDGRPGYRIGITDITGSFSAAPVATVTLTVTGETSGNSFSVDVGGAGMFSPSLGDELLFMPGEGVTVALTAPGGAVVARLNVTVRWHEDRTGSG